MTLSDDVEDVLNRHNLRGLFVPGLMRDWPYEVKCVVLEAVWMSVYQVWLAVGGGYAAGRADAATDRMADWLDGEAHPITLSDETRTELRAAAEKARKNWADRLTSVDADHLLALLDEIDQLRADGIRERAMTDSAVEHMNTAAAAVDRVRALKTWSDPGRLGGIPCVYGTRVPVSQIVEMLDEFDDKYICEMYPTVEPWQVAVVRALNGPGQLHRDEAAASFAPTRRRIR